MLETASVNRRSRADLGVWKRSIGVWVVCALAAAPIVFAFCLLLGRTATPPPAPSFKAIEVAPAPAAAQPDLYYRERALQARARAVSKGWVSYAEVVRAVYGPNGVSPRIMAAKAAYRARMQPSFTFFADYSTMSKRTALEEMEHIPNENPNRVLIGLYDSTHNHIDLASAAGPSALYHEAGHALQQQSLLGARRHDGEGRIRSLRESPLIDSAVQGGHFDSETERRFRYLSSQDEFEVRLQDLNRFYATMVGPAPIMTPYETVRALSALGMELTFEETRDVFALQGMELSQTEFEALTNGRPISRHIVNTLFDDAADIFKLRAIALRGGQALWQEALRKIIFEAPGHI